MEMISKILLGIVYLGMAFCAFQIIVKIFVYRKLYRHYPNGMKRYLKLIASYEKNQFVSVDFIQGESDYELTKNLHQTMRII